MSPTVFKEDAYRFFFFSREESRIHVHVVTPNGEAKYWLEPQVEIAEFVGLVQHELNHIEKIILDRKGEIIDAWNNHFGC